MYYMRCHKAYERIFARAGIPEVVSVSSDSGMMGGSVSHEFMLFSPIGEDSIAICDACGHSANVAAADCIVENIADGDAGPLTIVATPGMQTIEDVCRFLDAPKEKSCKAVVYQRSDNDAYVVLFIRGDLEINETKLTNFLGCDIRPADITEDCGLTPGYIGPYLLMGNGSVLYDRSLQSTNNIACGANIAEYHYTGLDIARDIGAVAFHDFAKIADGGICPHCGKNAIRIRRGIEVGNIFQLGTKYTEAMNMQYVDADGNLQYPVMGCYGIGVGRLAASVCEARHDEFGPIWPMAIAPWQVYLCAVRSDDAEVRACADRIYETLQQSGVEVLYDDRAISAGVMFSAADLLGVPVRLIVSPRNLKNRACELTTRDKSVSRMIDVESVCPETETFVRELLKRSPIGE